MSTNDLVPELAARLDRLVPSELTLGDWDDVARRLRPTSGRRGLFGVRVLVATAVFVLLAGAATATYFLTREGAPVRPRPGSLTVVGGGYTATTSAEIVELLPGGRSAVVWRCPTQGFCGDLTSVDWAPDGRHVAFTLDEFSLSSGYVGLHVLDLQTGRDLHLPLFGEPKPPLAALGCNPPTEVAWSGDSTHLAYACSRTFGWNGASFFTIRSDGTERRELLTKSAAPEWPSWSPDGTRIAYSARSRSSKVSSVYVMNADGTRRVRLVQHGLAPDWSPDGASIAYRSPFGVRFVTPAGKDVTPLETARPPFPVGIKPNGVPAWSPDGSKLAISTPAGVYVVDRSGAHARLVTRDGARSAFGAIRPAWYPGAAPAATSRTTPDCGGC